MVMSALRTPLTYYGGKQRLASQIVDLMSPHRVYLEPFAGGAAVLFAKPRADRETLNDLDGSIMAFWRALREQPEALAMAVAATPFGRAEWKQSSLPGVFDDVEIARRLLVNVDQSFGRTRRSWSTPYIGDGGRWQPKTWVNLPPRLLATAERLQGVALESSDAIKMIARWDRPDTVMYLDPPYTGASRTAPGAGYNVDDDGSLWGRLVAVLTEVRHAHVLLSGYPCVEADSLGWRAVALDALKWAKAGRGNDLERAPEVIWTNR